MGMNHPGEIAYLARIARPNVAIVTNAQRAHLAGMGTLETIATEKGSVFMALSKTGVAVINSDDPWASLWRSQAGGRQVMDFSFEQDAFVKGLRYSHGLESRLSIAAQGKTVEVVLSVPGAHNARNALGAAAVGLAAGISLDSVRDGLAAFVGVKGRLQRKNGLNGAVVLDDTYNASVESVLAAIDTLAAMPGYRVLVFGDMGELGLEAEAQHRRVGQHARLAGLDAVYTVGPLAALSAEEAHGRHFADKPALLAALGDLLQQQPAITLLAKGARSSRMEEVIAFVKNLKEQAC